MDVPRRSVQFVTVAEEITIVSLVCEDLAENDEVAERHPVGRPDGVITVLLDGPQLTSRWAARYASVLADDPGSAVLTLTSFGMVQRSRPAGRDASTVVALWKDPERGIREIPLEPGAQAVLLTVVHGLARPGAAPTAAGPSTPGPHLYDVAVHQIGVPEPVGLLVGRRRGGAARPRRVVDEHVDPSAERPGGIGSEAQGRARGAVEVRGDEVGVSASRGICSTTSAPRWGLRPLTMTCAPSAAVTRSRSHGRCCWWLR